jgi:hypothetical protein
MTSKSSKAKIRKMRSHPPSRATDTSGEISEMNTPANRAKIKLAGKLSGASTETIKMALAQLRD